MFIKNLLFSKTRLSSCDLFSDSRFRVVHALIEELTMHSRSMVPVETQVVPCFDHHDRVGGDFEIGVNAAI